MATNLQKWCANKHNLADPDSINQILFEPMDIGNYEELIVCGIDFIYHPQGEYAKFFEIRLDDITPEKFLEEIAQQ